jgi:hypothetical protein
MPAVPQITLAESIQVCLQMDHLKRKVKHPSRLVDVINWILSPKKAPAKLPGTVVAGFH